MALNSVCGYGQYNGAVASNTPANYPESIVHPLYGIQEFEPFNMVLGNGSVRVNEKGVPFNGPHKDYYNTRKLLHNGYYVNGRLRNYVNYYPNGRKERDFKMNNQKEASLNYYHENGALKSQIAYVGKFAKIWSEYNMAGTLIHFERFNDKLRYYESIKTYYPEGKIKSSFDITNPKKILYIEKEYHANGQEKLVGKVKYSQFYSDYLRVKKWVNYDENGKTTRIRKYKEGKLIKDKII